MAWPARSARTLLSATGITNKSLRALMTGLTHAPYTPGQMTYARYAPSTSTSTTT